MFVMLNVIRNYIVESDLDWLFVEPEIHGLTTLAQIKYGQHLKRRFDELMIFNLSLTHMYVNDQHESLNISSCANFYKNPKGSYNTLGSLN